MELTQYAKDILSGKIKREKKIPIPTPEAPYLPIEKAIQQGQISKDLTAEPMKGLPKFDIQSTYKIPPGMFVSDEQIKELQLPKEQRTLQFNLEQYLTSEQATKLGMEVPEGSLLKMIPTENEPVFKFVTPPPREEMESAIRAVYPEFEQIPTEQITDFLRNEAVSNYPDFVSNLTERVGETEARRIQGLLGIPAQNIISSMDYVAQNKYAIDTIQKIFPNYSIADLNYLIENEPNTFQKELTTYRTDGATREDKRKLLELLEVSPDAIDALLRVERKVIRVDGNAKVINIDTKTQEAYDDKGEYLGVFNGTEAVLPPRNVIQSLLRGFQTGSIESGFGFEAGVRSTLPQQLLSSKRPDLSIATMYAMAGIDTTYIPGSNPEFEQGIVEASKWAREQGRKLDAEHQEWLETNKLKIPEFDKPLRDAWNDPKLKGKKGEYLTYHIVSNLVPTITAMGVGVVTTTLTGSPFVGALASGAVFYPIEHKEVYDAVVDAGGDPDDAAMLAGIATPLIASVEYLSDVIQLDTLTGGLFKKALRKAGIDAVKVTIPQLVGKFVTNAIKMEITETLEEVIQEGIKNATVKFIDENKSLFENLPETALETLVTTLPMALLGGGSEMIGMAKQGVQVPESIEKGVSEAILKQQPHIMPEEKAITPKVTKATQYSIDKVTQSQKIIEDIVPQEIKRESATRRKQLTRAYESLELHSRKLGVPIPKLGTYYHPEEYLSNARQMLSSVEKSYLAKPSTIISSLKPTTPAVETGAIPIVGQVIETFDKGRMRSWGTITKIEGNDVHVYRPNNPKGYQRQIEKLSDVQKWIQEGVIRYKEKPKVFTPSEGKLFEEAIPPSGKITPTTPAVETGEVEVELAKPPPPPELPPTAVTSAPTPHHIDRIINQTQRQIEATPKDAIVNLFHKVPGIRKFIEFLAPKWKLTGDNQKILVSMNAEQSAIADVATRELASRTQLLRDIKTVFGKDVLRGGKADVKIENGKYVLTSDQRQVLKLIDEHNTEFRNLVVQGYDAEIGEYKVKPRVIADNEIDNPLTGTLKDICDTNGIYLPNVDMPDDVTVSLQNETRAVVQGRGKTRVWNTARDRMAHDKSFNPVLDVQKLLEGSDSFKARAAGGMTYRKVIGGLTKLETIEKTHPELYEKMSNFRKKLQRLQGYKRILTEQQLDAIDTFLSSSHEDEDIQTLDEAFFLQAGRYVAKAQAGKQLADINNAIQEVKDDIRKLLPDWKSANLKPYVIVKEGIYRYFTAEQANLIIESRQTSNGSFDPVLKFGENWRQTTFSTDGSPIGIQGQISALADPIGSLVALGRGVVTAIQRRNALHAFSFDALVDRIADDPESFAQYASLSGRQLTGVPSEYGSGFLRYIPKIGETLGKINESTYLFVTNRSYDMWVNQTKDLMKSGVTEMEAKIIAMDLANRVLPLYNFKRAGLSEARAKLIRAMPTSYSFIMQPASLISESTTGFAKMVTGQKLTARESLSVKMVVRMATTTLIASATSAGFVAKLRGKDDDEVLKAIRDAVNPDPYNGKFASLIIPVGSRDVRIPLGGPFRAIFRAIYPKDVKGVSFSVPFAGMWDFMINRINPMLKTQIDLVRNEDYYGRGILKGNVPEKFLRGVEYELENFIPLTPGGVIEDIRGKKEVEEIVINSVGQFMGVNPVILDSSYLYKQVGKLGEFKNDPPPELSIERPRYTTKDLWGDGNRLIKDITTEEIGRHDFPPQIKALARARDIKNTVDLIPSRKLTDINSDPSKGDTYIEFYQQWNQREKLNESEQVTFDKQYPDAHMGNMTAREYDALRIYHSLGAKEQADYLKAHPALYQNPREEYLRSHPKENAQLALFGQAKLLSQNAYNELQGLIKGLDIPDSGLPNLTLPPDKSVKAYFEYQDMENKQSWEAQFLIAKDDDLRKFLGREKIETPTASLEIKTKPEYRRIYDLIKSYGDRDSSAYIADEKRRAEAISNARTQSYIEDTRRIQAIEAGTNEKPTDPKIVNAWVERGKVIDEFEPGSSEAKVWLVDNPEVWNWALQNELPTERGDDWNIPVLRLNVKWRKEDEEYNNLPTQEETDDRDNYLRDNEEYRKDRKRRDAYSEEFGDTYVETYVQYYELPDKGYRRERMLIEIPEFGQKMVDAKKVKEINTHIPSVEYDNIYDDWKIQFDKLDALTKDATLTDDQKETSRKELRFNRDGTYTDFGIAEITRDAYGKFIPEQFVGNYVTYTQMKGEHDSHYWRGKTGTDKWYEDDWFLKEHPDYYNTVYLGILGNNPRNFDDVPTRNVFNKYVEYLRIPEGKARQNYRFNNPDLDIWGRRVFGWQPVEEEQELTPFEKSKETISRRSRSWEEQLAEIERLLKR